MAASGLFTEFDPVTYEEWLAATSASLRGRSIATLIKSSYEGIDIHPLTCVDDLAAIAHVDTLPGQFPYARGTEAAGYHSGPWLIAQEIDISDPAAFNLALKHALANGQTAIVLSEANPFHTVEDIGAAFADIDLDTVPILLANETRTITTYRLLMDYLGKKRISKLHGGLGYDPLHGLARKGALNADAFEQMAAYVAEIHDSSPALRSIAVRSDIYHDAGANAVQELALVAATAIEYLRQMSERGLAVDLVAGKLQCFLNIGENFFTEVAKLRAIRLIWAQVIRAFGGDERSQKLRLHVRTGGRNKTRLDPQVNMLRATSEALAAAIGGVDSLMLAPFDAPLGQSEAFSRRIARNLQLILRHELQLTHLIDPAGGSWHVEKLTDQLARAAWKLLQETDARGGMLASLQSGYAQTEIEAVAEQRLRDMESREAVLVGSNMYADPNQTSPSSQRQPRPLDDDSGARDSILARPLDPIRLAESFEMASGPIGGGG